MMLDCSYNETIPPRMAFTVLDCSYNERFQGSTKKIIKQRQGNSAQCPFAKIAVVYDGLLYTFIRMEMMQGMFVARWKMIL